MKFIIDHEKIKGEKIGTIDPVIIKDPELLMPKRATKGSAGYDMIMPVSVNFRSAHISVKPHVYFDTYIKIEDMPSVLKVAENFTKELATRPAGKIARDEMEGVFYEIYGELED